MIELKADGAYIAEPLDPRDRPLTGLWGVKAENMLWTYQELPHAHRAQLGGADDINHIVPGDHNHFKLVEPDNSTTTYVCR